MKNIISVETMDRLQRERAKELENELQEIYNKVQISLVNLGYAKDSRQIRVDVYENEYDFKSIYLKFTLETNIEEDVEIIKYALSNKRYYTKHIASATEKYIHMLLKEYECENLWIHDGELYGDGDYTVGLDYVDYMNFDRENGIIEFIEDSGEKTIVDLIECTIEWIEDEEDIVDFRKDAVEFLNQLKPFDEGFKVNDKNEIIAKKDGVIIGILDEDIISIVSQFIKMKLYSMLNMKEI